MKRVLALFGLVSLLAVLGVVPIGSAGAAATTTPVVALFQNIEVPVVRTANKTDVWVVHGLNLAGQTAQADGGTAVTVCAGGTSLIADLQFGDIVGPVSLDTGAVVPIDVFLGAGVDCATAATPVISQDVTVPDVAAAALVATSGPGPLTPALLPVVLDVNAPEFCGNAGKALAPAPAPNDGHLQAVHAASAPEVSVTLNGNPVDNLTYGQTLNFDLAPATYSVAVLLGATPIVGPADVTIDPCMSTVIYVVGNQTLPVAPTTTTTAPPAAAAAATAATPSFTG